VKHLPIERSLTDRAYEAILEAICDGGLPSGEKVTQDELAARLDVSRQPVVQALLLLKMQGFVRDSGKRGIVVAPLEPEAIAHLYEVRSALDGAAARGAALRGRAEARLWGAQLIAEGRAAVAAGSVKRMIAADIRFHRFLYELSGNPVIGATAAPHWHHIRRVMGSYLRRYPARDSIWDEHQAILDAVIVGDAAKAEAAARHHADRALANLIPLLQTPPRSEVAAAPKRRKR
jgi:DNA-binding GntR family transcriptional regulator